MNEHFISRIFPCKSINVKRFMNNQGIPSEHKYIDKEDGKTCWIYIRDDKFNNAIAEYNKHKYI